MYVEIVGTRKNIDLKVSNASIEQSNYNKYSHLERQTMWL
jgi:hypothetical protein